MTPSFHATTVKPVGVYLSTLNSRKSFLTVKSDFTIKREPSSVYVLGTYLEGPVFGK